MDSFEVIGNRVYKIRCVAGYGARKQKKFADLLQFEEDSYSQWEIGKILIPVYAAITICEWTGNAVTLDYIYRGRSESVGLTWMLQLRDAADRPSFVAKKRGQRGH